MVSLSFVLQMNLPFDDLYFNSFKIENRFSSPAVHPDPGFLTLFLTVHLYRASAKSTSHLYPFRKEQSPKTQQPNMTTE